MPKSLKVISLNASLLTYKEALEQVKALATNRQPSYGCFANSHMIAEAYWSKSFAEQVNNADFVFTDGKPFAWAVGFLYKIQQERIAGMDFMESLIKEAEKSRLKVFLYGSTDEILQKITARLQDEYPLLSVSGAVSPPFRQLSEAERNAYIKQINDSGTNIVFVALGCPKQEIWMAENSSQIQAVCLGVGGAFPVFAKTQKRSPVLMQKMGLEWVFRLFQEPKRLFKRYFTTNFLFVCLLLKQKIFGKV